MSAVQQEKLVESAPLCSFPTSRSSRIAADLRTFNGRRLVAVGVQFKDISRSGWRWTPRTIIVDAALLPDLERILSTLRAAVASNVGAA